MSETGNLKLKKHDNVETNTEKFDIKNYLNGNWDKIDENVGEVNTNISNIKNEKAELEKELKEAQEDFYQNSIRGQASGEYIHVEDSSNCRAKIGIGGNDEQETRSGKNLLELMEGTYSNNGITAVVKNGIVTLNGAATAISFVGINLLKNFNLITGNTYRLSAFNTEVVGDSSNNYCSLRLNGEGTKETTLNKTNSNNAITGNFLLTYITIRTAQGITYNNFVVKPQLELGAGTSTWEQGGVSPSSDYQSEIKAVGDNVNLANLGEKAQYTSSGFTVSWEDSVFKMSGTASTNLTIPANVTGVTNAINLGNFKAGTYTISKKILNGNVINAKGSGIYLRSSNGMIASIYIVSIKDRASFTLTEDTNIYIYVFIDSETQYSDLEIGIKIAEGTEVGEYSNYGQGCVKVTKCNKNLFDKNTTTNNTALNLSNGSSVTFNGRSTSDYITVKANTKYVFSKDGEKLKVNIVEYDKNKNFIKGYTGDAFTTSNDTRYIKFYFGTADMRKIQLEQDVIVTSYEEHQEQSYIMPTQAEMLEGDYFDFGNEEEVHIWGKLFLTGEETWHTNINSGWEQNKHVFAVLVSGVEDNGQTTNVGKVLKSNNFKCVNTGDLVWKTQDLISYYPAYRGGSIMINHQGVTTLTDFKAWLKAQYDAGTPVIIYYKLATPTKLAFIEEQKAVAKELNNARTYKNVTNIYSTDEISPILSLDYAKDLETLLTSKESEV